MLALLYLAVAISLGDHVCRRFWSFETAGHRWAAAFLVGVLFSAWATYLFALAFNWSARPLLWANLLFFLLGPAILLVLARQIRPRRQAPTLKPTRLEIAFLGVFIAISAWLMFGTFTMHNGDVRLSSVVWNDFGPNLALIQSFALGHNFPTEYPYFSGESIRYHFLFWFATGNLEFLGLRVDWALNLLSTLSMVALLLSIMALGELLFVSRIVGGITALLLFLPGTLSFIPFFKSQPGIGSSFASILHLKHWLSSGFHFAGEDWGMWSISILYVQRHLLGAIGIFCLVLIFLIQHYKAWDLAKPSSSVSATEPDSQIGETTPAPADWRAFIFSGALIGLLPMWNGPIFLSAVVVVGCFFLVFPNRSRVGALLLTAVVIGAPQVFFLGFAQTAQRMPLLRWGFTVENPTCLHVASYFLFIFGPKLVLASVALCLLRRSHRLFFLGISGLIVLAFGTQLSIDMMNNQKFLYLWLILLNLFVASALVRIWRIRRVGKPLAIVATMIISATGIIEMFRVHNDNWVDVPFRGNALSDWLFQNSKPTELFLTDRFVHHPIMTSGRRIFYGWPYFSWSMGYNTGERDAIYASLVREQDPEKLLKLLKTNKIDYVAVDDGLRHGPFDVGSHEAVLAGCCARVFEDKEKRFGNLTIYRVPR